MRNMQWQPASFFSRLSIMEKRKGDTYNQIQEIDHVFEARKIVEEQQSAPGKSYASITKGAGVRCTDAQTQIDVTYDIQLPSTSSGASPTPKSGQNAGGGPPPATQTSAGGGSRPAQKPSSVLKRIKTV